MFLCKSYIIVWLHINELFLTKYTFISEPTIIFEVGKKYLITTAYKKQRPNQISLTQGKLLFLHTV